MIDLNSIPFYLKSCPFCGGNAEVIKRVYRKRYFREDDLCFYVRCKVCKATSAAELTEAEAAEDWNRRADK